MGIENIMYFALGLLIAGLVALMIMPAIWRRAVRLTKKRIEAATPMTMAEFRADKDQLRAEFAVKARQLETTIETLRRRLAEHVGEVSSKRYDISALQTDRERHDAIVTELEERETELRRHVLRLEKDNVDLAQRLRMRERDYEARLAELESARKALRGELPPGSEIDAEALSGDYAEDVEALLNALTLERKRTDLLEQQARDLVGRLDTGSQPADTGAVVAELRKALAAKAATAEDGGNNLILAEARIASAENRLNALLDETRQLVESNDSKAAQSLAEKFSLEEQMDRLKGKVAELEKDALTDFDNADALRERLAEIASDVSRLVYSAEADIAPEVEESLFDRVQKFAADSLVVEEIALPPPVRTQATPKKRGKVTDRMAALKEIQRR